ncbi:MAG: hypothetical protein M3Y27_00575 [Acidobacteriota bacterium]|nr:hypothetical protein [Acidobacteriota bacterium]
MYLIALDTNVVISALRSRRGASFAILRRLGDDWVPLISVPLILELAVAGRADGIVTHNVKHFVGAEQFGIRVMTPREFLRKIEGEGT